MRPLRHRRKPAGWPFYLLVLAWFCANSPQSLSANIIAWAKGARHFSHQQQLRADVTLLLSGGRTSAVVETARAPSTVPVPVPVADETTLKKIDLSVPRQVDGLLRDHGAQVFVVQGDRVPKSDRAEPALFPPRPEGAA